jgi:hypothetical protein
VFENWLLVLIWMIVIAFLAVGGVRGLRRSALARQAKGPPSEPASTAQVDAQPNQTTAPQAQPFNPIALAKQLEEPYGAVSHPGDMLGSPEFEAGVARLTDPAVPLDQVVNYCVGANEQLAALGAEALARRDDSASATARVATRLHSANVWVGFFMLRFLDARADRSVIGLALPRRWMTKASRRCSAF